MSLRDDVRWLADAADGLLVGWLPPRLPTWATKEGEKLGWLVLLLWRKFYDASMARTNLEAEVARLKGDVDGLRETNERLTDLVDDRQREAVATMLGLPSVQEGYYWVRHGEAPKATVAAFDGEQWWIPGSDASFPTDQFRLLSGRIKPPP